jgi:ParB-like chromosome segregation protein Spo0J/DNA modification methylase
MKPTHSVPISDIQIVDRQRGIDAPHVASLKQSIASLGLIQPIVINQNNRLIAGNHRLHACKELGWPTIPVVYVETLSEDQLQEMELTEDTKRLDRTWQQKCLAIAKIHMLKKRTAALNAEKWGQRETGDLLGISGAHINYSITIARELLADKESPLWGADNMAEAWKMLLAREQDVVNAELARRQQQLVASLPAAAVGGKTAISAEQAALRHNPMTATEIQKNYDDKLHAMIEELGYDRYVEEVMEYPHLFNRLQEHYLSNPDLKETDPSFHDYWAEKIRVIKNRDWTVPVSRMLVNDDCIKYMTSEETLGLFDHIITDIPYGIDMEQLNQGNDGHAFKDIGTVLEEHKVEDNLSLFEAFFPAAYRCTKPNAFVITWCDMFHWRHMHDLAIAAGFKVQRWPVTWVKTHRCMNQSAQFNFTKSTEVALICRKGLGIMTEPAGECHIIAGHDELKAQLGHPFVKPFAIWEYLLKHVTLEGQLILEPFAGRGSGVISMLRMNRKVIGVELNTEHYNALLQNVKSHYKSISPNYTFA